MPKVYLSRRVVFAASHRLHANALSDQENQKIFGKCNRKNGHGHNYQMNVVLKGEIDPKTGMLYNLNDLRDAIDRTVMEAMDHRNLNTDVEEFVSLNPTTENLAVVCWNRLLTELPKDLLYEVELWETENNRVIYRGE